MIKPFYNQDNFEAQTSLGCLLRRLSNLMGAEGRGPVRR